MFSGLLTATERHSLSGTAWPVPRNRCLCGQTKSISAAVYCWAALMDALCHRRPPPLLLQRLQRLTAPFSDSQGNVNSKLGAASNLLSRRHYPRRQLTCPRRPNRKHDGGAAGPGRSRRANVPLVPFGT